MALVFFVLEPQWFLGPGCEIHLDEPFVLQASLFWYVVSEFAVCISRWHGYSSALAAATTFSFFSYCATNCWPAIFRASTWALFLFPSCFFFGCSLSWRISSLLHWVMVTSFPIQLWRALTQFFFYHYQSHHAYDKLWHPIVLFIMRRYYTIFTHLLSFWLNTMLSLVYDFKAFKTSVMHFWVTSQRQ